MMYILRLRSVLKYERKLVRAFCFQAGDEKEVMICNYNGQSIQRGSAHRLQPGEWLNDELIQYFAALVSNSDEPSKMFSTFFYNKLMDLANTGIYSYESVQP
jgi:Ulp1 family protease